MNLFDYQQDGANFQARSVLCFLQGMNNLQCSWDDETKTYLAQPKVARWENCREQGYIITLISPDYSTQLNIIFFEHRNSDQICAVKWEQKPTLNTPTIGTAKFGDIYKDKYDVSHSVGFGKVNEMADWILEQLTDFWKKNKTK